MTRHTPQRITLTKDKHGGWAFFFDGGRLCGWVVEDDLVEALKHALLRYNKKPKNDTKRSR